jgi:hypothetical protein
MKYPQSSGGWSLLDRHMNRYDVRFQSIDEVRSLHAAVAFAVKITMYSSELALKMQRILERVCSIKRAQSPFLECGLEYPTPALSRDLL